MGLRSKYFRLHLMGEAETIIASPPFWVKIYFKGCRCKKEKGTIYKCPRQPCSKRQTKLENWLTLDRVIKNSLIAYCYSIFHVSSVKRWAKTPQDLFEHCVRKNDRWGTQSFYLIFRPTIKTICGGKRNFKVW